MIEQTAVASKLEQAYQLRCVGCGQVAADMRQNLRCLSCGELLEVIFPAWNSAQRPPEMQPSALKATWKQRRGSTLPQDESGVWRFRELLPALQPGFEPITLREGNTPLYEMLICARIAGVETLYAKHQGMNPTGSFKDTGMTTAASFARQEGYRWVACASTGNTSASMAAYAARGGLRSLVLIPDGKITWSKLSQSLDYGALTCQLKTDFDGCMKVLNDVVRRMPIYMLNSMNPYRAEGQKTAAFELLEKLDWQVPDHIIAPGGNLANSSAIGKAVMELYELGIISSLPKISVIQAAGANPLVRTMRENGGKKLVPVQAETMASAIRIGNPASWRKAVRILERTAGTVEDVTEQEIALAKAEIGAEGIGCEPASAVTFAGLKKLVRSGFVRKQESVVLVLTGHVLKDAEYTLKFHRGDLFEGDLDQKESAALARQQRAPIVLEATTDAVLKALEQAEKKL